MTQRRNYRNFICSAAALFAVLSFAAHLPAMPLNPGETTGPAIFMLDNGSRGSGTNALSETGFQQHGAFGSPPASIGAARLFEGEAAESQATGTHDIPFKNAPVEQITDIFPNRVPTLSTTYFGGGNFDGTALWLIHSRFASGGAPPVGSTSPPTQGTNPVASAGTGVDIRRPNADLVLLDITTGEVNTFSFLTRADVFMPDHNADPSLPGNSGTTNPSEAIFSGAYVDREGFGLLSPGGMGLDRIFFAPGEWSELEIRTDITLDGGPTGSNTDDAGTIMQTFFLNGIEVGTRNNTLDPTQMTLRNGPVRFSPAFGLQRGWQNSAAEGFLDNVALFQIVPEPPPFIPEPSSFALLGLGLCGLLRRRRKSSSSVSRSLATG